MRHPVSADAAAIHRLVRTDGGLDLNSLYCYLLIGRDFSRTSLVAIRRGTTGESLAGFVSAYRPPERPGTLFIWQIGVARDARRQGLARRMLHRLLALPACRGIRLLEATVTPSNEASRGLFTRLAADLGAACRVEPGFAAELFAGGGPSIGAAGAGDAHEPHEREDCFVIGPLAGAGTTAEERRNHEGL
jgi:L-2,4-diaminobutyric acid acetyltransferase